MLHLAEREKRRETKRKKEGCFYERTNEKKNWGNVALLFGYGAHLQQESDETL